MNVTGFIHRRTVSLFCIEDVFKPVFQSKTSCHLKIEVYFCWKSGGSKFLSLEKWKNTQREITGNIEGRVPTPMECNGFFMCPFVVNLICQRKHLRKKKKKKKKRNACLVKINIKVKRGFCIHIRCVDIYNIYMISYILYIYIYIIC